MSAKDFWISFADGLVGEGIFGDLRLPGSPTRMFAPELDDSVESKPGQSPIRSDQTGE